LFLILAKFHQTTSKIPKRGGSKPAPAKSSRFKAENFARPCLFADEVEEMKEAFDLVDIDGSGAISIKI
jgi:hypothetical protein